MWIHYYQMDIRSVLVEDWAFVHGSGNEEEKREKDVSDGRSEEENAADDAKNVVENAKQQGDAENCVKNMEFVKIGRKNIMI